MRRGSLMTRIRWPGANLAPAQIRSYEPRRRIAYAARPHRSGKGKPPAYREAISRIAYESLVSVGVPKDDRFQLIAEYEAKNFVFDPNYLDIRHTEDLVIIQITRNEGRTVEQKKALYKAIADGLANELSLRREDVFIGLIEVRRENWSFGNGVAQYAK